MDPITKDVIFDTEFIDQEIKYCSVNRYFIISKIRNHLENDQNARSLLLAGGGKRLRFLRTISYSDGHFCCYGEGLFYFGKHKKVLCKEFAAVCYQYNGTNLDGQAYELEIYRGPLKRYIFTGLT